MNKKLDSALLARACRIARKQSDMSSILSEAFNERYGVTYSDVDCDWLIDSLDYGLSDNITLKEADYWMTEAGYPPLPAFLKEPSQ